MHELSLSQAIMDTVQRHSDGRPVDAVTVRIGYFRQVVPDSLRFSWEMLTMETPLAGAELRIEHIPGVVTCRACAAESTLDMPMLLCPRCESPDVELITGREFQIASIDVREEVH